MDVCCGPLANIEPAELSCLVMKELVEGLRAGDFSAWVMYWVFLLGLSGCEALKCCN